MNRVFLWLWLLASLPMPTRPRRGPNIRRPTPSGRIGLTSTVIGSSASTQTTRDARTLGKSRAREGFDQTIVVPFPWESELSRIHKPEYHGVAWYRQEFHRPR